MCQRIPEGEYQTVTLEELFVMLQEDENLRQQIAQQLAVETDDPQVLVRIDQSIVSCRSIDYRPNRKLVESGIVTL